MVAEQEVEVEEIIRETIVMEKEMETEEIMKEILQEEEDRYEYIKVLYIRYYNEKIVTIAWNHWSMFSSNYFGTN